MKNCRCVSSKIAVLSLQSLKDYPLPRCLNASNISNSAEEEVLLLQSHEIQRLKMFTDLHSSTNSKKELCSVRKRRRNFVWNILFSKSGDEIYIMYQLEIVGLKSRKFPSSSRYRRAFFEQDLNLVLFPSAINSLVHSSMYTTII